MKQIKIKKIKDYVGKEVKVSGFVQTIRIQSKIIFIVLRDYTGVIQLVSLEKDSFFDELKKITIESVLEISGVVKEETQAIGGFEIRISDFKILSKAFDLPIQVLEKSEGQTNFSKRIDYRWLDLRKPEKKKIIEIWTSLEKGFRKYLEGEDFKYLYSPSFMETPSESGAEVFEVKYFDKKAYLAQSPQFYKQMAIASGFDKVFISSSVFRAEKSNTSRHLTEFTGWDFEVAYVQNIQELIDIEEDMIISGFKKIEKEFPDIGLEIPKKGFPQISMKEVKKLLAEKGIKSEKEGDLSSQEEIEISKFIKKKYGHDFVFVTDFPIETRPFYHMRFEEKPQITKSFDLLYKGIEITTGAIREHRIDVLKKQALEKRMDLESLEKYFEFFQFGCPPHGGCGIGPARIVMKILDLENIKEAVFLPRDVQRLSP